MKVLQINSVCGYGSTGRIVTDLADILHENGHECLIAYGRGQAPAKYQNCSVNFGNSWDFRFHVLRTRLLDEHGFGSKNVTQHLLQIIHDFNPDIIHLHNIHGYYLNIEVLFDYLKNCGKPIVWTLHDCWAFTGHCAYFSAFGCTKWKDHCMNCKQKYSYPCSIFRDNSKQNFNRKYHAFTSLSNLTIITPSQWLASIVKKSFLRNYNIKTIYNGIDLNQFKPTPYNVFSEYGIKQKVILGVANKWEKRKGLQDFIDLSRIINNDEYKIVLIGLSRRQIKKLPSNILGIERSNSLQELVQYYSSAYVYVNTSIEETLGLTTAEALACGTPVITYNKTAVPEVPDESCGIVVECMPQNIALVLDRVHYFKKAACIERAKYFDKKERYLEYLSLYNKINQRIV